MRGTPTQITLTINGSPQTWTVGSRDMLLHVLRDHKYFSVKQGCDTGDCGICTVLVDGKPVRSCMTRAVDVAGKSVQTTEGLSQNGELHPIQEAFMETGGAQCGFCTPGKIMTAKALLDRNPDPTVEEVREAMSGVLCRCTGYVRTNDAVLRAARKLRGEDTGPLQPLRFFLTEEESAADAPLPEDYRRADGDLKPLPPVVITPPDMPATEVVGKPEIKVDARKLVLGRPVYAFDKYVDGMLYAALLTSPHAHARIIDIDTSAAEALPGVHAVLTYKNVPRIKYASGGQSPPQPPPYDQVMFDNKVRHVGDRVAAVAAETPELAEKALRLIKVKYEALPHVIDPLEAMRPGAPVIHDEEDTEGIYDAQRNIVFHIEAEVGDVDKAFAEADYVHEAEYYTPKQQHVHLEPHVTITWWDEDDRLVVYTSTQVPFHVRRIIAPLIGVDPKRIRVIKPRIGGGFGNKQEIILEDVCAMLTVRTGRAVRLEYSRKQEFYSSRSSHPNIVRYKVGVKDGKVTAAQLYFLGDTGAYGAHALTVQMVGGFKGLTLYNAPNSRFISDAVYTNQPPTGAFRGYGATQAQYGYEVIMAEIAEKLGLDVVEFKRNNLLKVGEPMLLAKKLGEGREGYEQALTTSAIEECLDIGLRVTDFYAKRKAYANQTGRYRKGIGFATTMHGSGIAGLDMAAATIKMWDDGAFFLTVGATDIGTGSDTILAQIAAEVLGVPLEDIVVYSSDTDFTPFDTGAYASSTTYISGGAVRNAAEKVKRQIQEFAAKLLEVDDPDSLVLRDRKVFAPDGRSVSLWDVGMISTHQMDQHQIMATGSHMSYVSPPPTAASFAEVTVDTWTGQVTVDRFFVAADIGRVINPVTAAGQVEGGVLQAMGFVMSEEMVFDEMGKLVNATIKDYHPYLVDDAPPIDVVFVETNEDNGPFGAKSVAELAMDGAAPAIVTAVHNATGVWVRRLPLYPERVWRAIRGLA